MVARAKVTFLLTIISHRSAPSRCSPDTRSIFLITAVASTTFSPVVQQADQLYEHENRLFLSRRA